MVQCIVNQLSWYLIWIFVSMLDWQENFVFPPCVHRLSLNIGMLRETATTHRRLFFRLILFVRNSVISPTLPLPRMDFSVYLSLSFFSPNKFIFSASTNLSPPPTLYWSVYLVIFDFSFYFHSTHILSWSLSTKSFNLLGKPPLIWQLYYVFIMKNRIFQIFHSSNSDG